MDELTTTSFLVNKSKWTKLKILSTKLGKKLYILLNESIDDLFIKYESK